MRTVLFAGGGTGGHLYPALNLGAAMQRLRPELHVHYVGSMRGVEGRVLRERELPFTLLPLEPLRRDRVWQNWRLIPSFARSARRLDQLFAAADPELVVGTGGYVSGPACAWALLGRIPVAVQEQNSFPGITTRILSRWVKQVHLGFPEAAEHLSPGRRTEVFALGNPIQAPDSSLDRADARRSFGIPEDALVLLVVGGSQGARAVNRTLADALERVAARQLPPPPAGLRILWATGPTHVEEIERRLAPLGVDEWVLRRGYIDRMAAALAASDLAISRAGAMATAELLAWGIPAILIPLPTAAANHQHHNAEALERAGAAVCLTEDALTPERLWEGLLGLAGDDARRNRMGQAARGRAHPHAAMEIAEKLMGLLPT